MVSAKDDKTNELYVNVGDGFTGRGGLVPWGCLKTKYVRSQGVGKVGSFLDGPLSSKASLHPTRLEGRHCP